MWVIFEQLHLCQNKQMEGEGQPEVESDRRGTNTYRSEELVEQKRERTRGKFAAGQQTDL